MDADSALRDDVKLYEVSRLGREAIENGGVVREATIRSGLVSYGSDYKPKKVYEMDRGLCIQNDGESRVFFADRYSDNGNYIETNLSSPDVSVTLGNALTVAGFDYKAAAAIRKSGGEVKRVDKEMPNEVLVENGVLPSAVQNEIHDILAAMNEKHGTPKSVDVPEKHRTAADYTRLLKEVKKLSHSLDAQYTFAQDNNAAPKYPSVAFEMTSDDYKQFKRDVAKNVARAHANGMLFTVEGKGDFGISISVQSPSGSVVGSLEIESDIDTEYRKFEVTEGNPIEIAIKTLPDVSRMSQKGQVSDNFREMVSKMRHDFAMVSPSSEPSPLVSPKDINDAVSSVSTHLESSGVSILSLSGAHPDIVSAKLTYLLSQKYPEIINEGLSMVIDAKKDLNNEPSYPTL